MRPAPGVNWNPQPLETLRARYPVAVKDVIDVRDVINKRRIAPTSDPLHVFDTLEGLRLIVSLERALDGRVGTHISASFHAPTRKFSSVAEVNDWVLLTWQALSGDLRTPQFLGVTDGLIPHFFLERGC